MTTADDFRQWLEREKRLSRKSIESYTAALAGILSDYAGVPLLQVTSFQELRSVSEKVLRNPDFVALNDRGHQMYSAAFNHYSDFLRERFGS